MNLKINPPVRIAIFDDDYYALKWNTALVMRDPRTTVVIESSSPENLIRNLSQEKGVDLVVLDAEFEGKEKSFENLLNEVRKVHDGKIVCLSQYGHLETVVNALQMGVDGFLLKDDVRMAIVSALLNAIYDQPVLSPAIAAKLKTSGSNHSSGFDIFPCWIPNPEMTPQILTAFWMRVFFGMRSPVAAEEMGLANGTVDRYVKLAYSMLPNEIGDEQYLYGLDLDQLSPEDRAFILFTLPPRLASTN